MTHNVEVISEETIKPSSPTPNHLKTFQLSLVDQYAPPVHVPLLLFYSANEHDKVENTSQTNRLKESLSEVLTQFYPLAGRITGHKTIDCSDEGVSFSVARISGELKQVLNNPIPQELDQLLPRIDEFYGLGPKVLLSIQVNIFSCGGMILAVCTSHKLLDGSSIGVFLKNWASLSRRDDSKISHPKFNMTSLFPPIDLPSSMPPMGSPQKVVSKRFIFDASNIAALRAIAKDAIENPTRVEVVSALIWRCAMNAVRMRTKSLRPSASVVNFAVNLRGRMDPPLSNDFVGNLMIGMPVESSTDIQQEFHSLVSQLRKRIRSIDSGYVRKLQSDNGLTELFYSTTRFFEMDVKGELEAYVISSWCRFPFYNADFGWGKPKSVTSVNLVAKNIIMLMDTNCGNGIEAWVSLIEEDMANFECEPDIITFTSAKPGIKLN